MKPAIPLFLALCVLSPPAASAVPDEPMSVGVVLGPASAIVAWTPIAADAEEEVTYRVHGYRDGAWSELDATANLSALVPGGYASYGVSASVNNGPSGTIVSACLTLRLTGDDAPGWSVRPSCLVPETLDPAGQGL